MFNLMDANFASQDGKIFWNKTKESVRLHAEGTVFGQKFYGEQKSYTFLARKEFVAEEYFVLEYTCLGLRRQLSYREPFIFAISEQGDQPLICYDDISTDNRRHRVVVRMPDGQYSGVKLIFYIDRRPKAHFSIHSMYTCTAAELPMCCDAVKAESATSGYSILDLSTLYNARLTNDESGVLIDGGRLFDCQNIYACGIPFRVETKGNNRIAPPLPPVENDDMIMNFGVQTKRGLCRPVSRDSLIEIPINRKATELFFIMSMSGNRYQRWGFASDGTILGSYCGDVTMPLLVSDVEGFMVELVYADGRVDTAFPLNVSRGRHGVQGDVSVYAVPADGTVIERVIFHNRKLGSDFSIVALTVNESTERKHPEMLIPERPEAIEHHIGYEKGMTLSDTLLTVKNGALMMEIDVSGGLELLKLTNDFIPDFSIRQSAMLKLRAGDGSITEQFTLLSASAQNDRAGLVYRAGTLELFIDAELGTEHDVKWSMKAVNTGAKAVRTGIIFPCISGMLCTDNADTWYFAPKYQNINSNETIFMYEESAPSFPMQFMDVYSPAQQGGFSLTTRERELVTRKYALTKDENGVELYVEYPELYGEIAPGETFTCSPAVMTAHRGDWRQSFAVYKQWLDSWYEPYQCQNKQWYRECFWLLAEITDFFETKEIAKFPCWHNEETGEVNFLKILEEQKQVAGCYPDILHLWAWANYVDEDGGIHILFGNFGDSDYEKYGGKEAFRKALHEVRDKTGVNVSLYLHPTLLSARYPQSEKYFPKYKVVNDVGENITLGEARRMCHANEEWRRHAISMYPRIYEDLGIPLLYVDEFSLRIENRCYGKDHGHPVPSSLLQTDRDLISELKDVMPEEVVLYGEYAAVDVNARYIDCNISYYIIDSVVDMIETAWRADDGDDRMSRVFTDVYRFAFPKIVQLVLPMAMRHLSWHPQKFIFFNGEAIYDSFWDVEESAGLAFTVKAYALKKKYADCFASDHPQTMVDTLSPAICANCFPGKGRTLYTVYNRAYTTYRGSILRVPHQEGAIYYDAWNEQPLEVNIQNGFAEIYLNIDAQQMGCIVISN